MNMQKQVLLYSLLFASILLGHPGELEATPKPQLTPLLMEVLAPPQAFLGADNAYHLVYEIKLSNVTGLDWELQSLTVSDPKNPTQSLKKFSGDALKKRMGLIGTRSPTTSLEANQSALIWMHLKFSERTKVPEQLLHQVDLQSKSQRLSVMGAPSKVNQAPVPTIGSPLKGDKWVAADGCCDSIRHVRAALPIDGELHTAQRYAIDWELMGPENRIFVGDSLKVDSYHCYGQEVYAVADGTVVQAVDRYKNQVPGKLPEKMTLEEADGNHVILKIGPQQYALYAHLKPDSVKVKTGDLVKAGQVLAQVGNTGNTSEPHLHFHLMDGPSALNSNGIPYGLNEFNWVGQVGSTEAFDKAAAEGTVLKIKPPSFPGFHQNQLPLDQVVIDFK